MTKVVLPSYIVFALKQRHLANCNWIHKLNIKALILGPILVSNFRYLNT